MLSMTLRTAFRVVIAGLIAFTVSFFFPGF